ncbi:MAG: hypothetical protein PHU40_02275 [Sulfurimonas sp.]|nr:hypothetical protein [Sulfurimonas sp.]
MVKIKVLGALVFSISIVLTIVSVHISQDNTFNNKVQNTINDQKAFTQEISKNIFYIYKNKDTSTKQLDNSIEMFLLNMNNQENISDQIYFGSIKTQRDEITLLWNRFYKYVQNFKDQSQVSTLYSNILLEQTIKDIYNTNLELVVAFENLAKTHQDSFHDAHEAEKDIQYILFFCLVALLIYLFSQLKNVILFMQKFLDTSKRIIKNATIKDLQPLKFNNNTDLLEATTNFNLLVETINNSVVYSSESIQNAYESLEVLEKNIEDLFELLGVMQEDDAMDKELTKKEDVLIQSLEELTLSTSKLKNLKKDLDNLITAATLN